MNWLENFGGKQDSALDKERDRVADVFPDEASIAIAGWRPRKPAICSRCSARAWWACRRTGLSTF